MNRSTHVRRYVLPWQGGKGPTRSICTWSKRESGGKKRDKGEVVWRCTLLSWHCGQARAQLRTSVVILGHKNLVVMRRCVPRIPGWERLCRDSNTWRRKATGTNGRGVPVDVSQRTGWLADGRVIGWNKNLGSLRRADNCESVTWASAMASKFTWTGREGELLGGEIARTELRDSASATMFCVPLTYWMSVENSAMNASCRISRGEWRVDETDVTAERSAWWSVRMRNSWPSSRWRKCRTARYAASNSRPKVLYRVSAGRRRLEKKASGCHTPSTACWRAAPTATSDASTMSWRGAPWTGWHRRVACDRAALMLQKAEMAASNQVNGRFLGVCGPDKRSVSGWMIWAHEGMKRR